jgi:hypothetical protein
MRLKIELIMDFANFALLKAFVMGQTRDESPKNIESLLRRS